MLTGWTGWPPVKAPVLNMTSVCPLVTVPSGNIISWGQPGSLDLCLRSSLVLALASSLSLLMKTVNKTLPMVPSTGRVDSSYFATGHDLVRDMRTQSRMVEWGAATRTGASSLLAWTPLVLMMTPRRRMRHLKMRMTECLMKEMKQEGGELWLEQQLTNERRDIT